MNTQNESQALLELVAQVLIRCFVGGVILVLIWIVACVAMGDWVYHMHSLWFDMSRQQFDLIHYCGIAATKMIVFVAFLVPYVCIRLVLRKHRSGG